jgi:hypothetical protein
LSKIDNQNCRSISIHRRQGKHDPVRQSVARPASTAVFSLEWHSDYRLAIYEADPALHLVYVERYDEQAVLHDPKIVKRHLDPWHAQEKVALESDQAADFLAFVGGPRPS